MSAPGPARAYLGLALLGWGLSILLQVAPHEDPFVGLGLLLFGIALVATAPARPRVRDVPWLPLLLAGTVAIGAVLAYDAVQGAPLNLTKLAILAYGAFLVVAGVIVQRPSLSARRKSQVSTAVVCSIPVVAAPLVMWSFQAGVKSLSGATPVESFVQFGLLLPLKMVLSFIGWQPVLDGQTITYNTPEGALAVNVGAACSGIQAMALFGGVIALYVFLERPAGRSLAVWSAIGIFGVYLANLERIFVLLAVGYRWGPDALVQVHEQAGWILFVAWTLLFGAIVRTPTKRASVALAPSEASGNP